MGKAIDEGIIGAGPGRCCSGAASSSGSASSARSPARGGTSSPSHNWLRAAFRSIQLVGHQSADVGEALPRTDADR